MAGKDDWIGKVGREWARKADVMDLMLGPFGVAAREALGDVADKRVLDLGCGGGQSSFELLEAGAEVVGVDVSPELIELAETRRAGRDIAFHCEDAAEATFDAPFDALYSRFGAMFFADTAAAFSNLRKGMKPGADMSIVCWRAARENDWAMAPMKAARDLLPPVPKGDPLAPGPFAWADPEASFAPALEAAGWSDVSWGPVDLQIIMGAGIEGDPVDAATHFCMRIGPLAGRLRGLEDELKSTIEQRVREAMTDRLSDGAVRVNGACWLISGRA
ncbi:MAG: class I SAM-dependent methyltransferase [Pikeienuella sp.]